ncbi:MAG: hypothetical protein ACTHMM_13840 [Agriterribacter sp.]
MKFDDYKKHFEQFSKIDTVEKLFIFRNQYENHLLHMEDEQFFESYIQRLESDISSQYEKNLNNIFLFDKIKENQFYFLIRPSFEPEYMLILEYQIDGYFMTHVALTKNYWTLFYANNKLIDVPKVIVKSELNKTIGKRLFLLLDKTIIEARQPKANSFTLDGVVYMLSKLYTEGQRIVTKHSPSETSKSGKIIEIMQQLIDNIGRLDEATLLNIETKISALQG